MNKTISEIRKEEQKKISALYESLGIFFAFSDKQFNEKKQEGVTYVGGHAGMVIPKDNAIAYVKGFTKIIAEFNEDLRKHSSMDSYILYSLYNYEAFYSGNFDETLSDVKIIYPECTMADVHRVYKANKEQ